MPLYHDKKKYLDSKIATEMKKLDMQGNTISALTTSQKLMPPLAELMIVKIMFLILILILRKLLMKKKIHCQFHHLTVKIDLSICLLIMLLLIVKAIVESSVPTEKFDGNVSLSSNNSSVSNTKIIKKQKILEKQTKEFPIDDIKKIINRNHIMGLLYYIGQYLEKTGANFT